MAGAHIDLHQQRVVVGLGGAQLRRPFGRLPIGHARIVQTAGDQQRRIVLRGDIVVRAVAANVFERLLVGDGLPHWDHSPGVSGSVSSSIVFSTSTNGTCAAMAPVEKGLIDDRAHQFAAR